MKISNLLESIQLLEMSIEELRSLIRNLQSLLSRNGYKFVMSNHAGIERLLNDPSRANINADDVLRTVEKLLSNNKFLRYKEEKVSYEGKVTNHSTGLNVVFYVDNRSNQFRIITAIKKDDFQSDNKPTKPFNVKT